MKVSVLFNTINSITLTPENPREKQLLQLFTEGSPGIKIGSTPRESPEALVFETVPQPKEKS